MTYQGYARLAAVVFFAITAYTVAVKVGQDRLADDWLHSVLHICSGAAGVFAGWLARWGTPAKVYTATIGLAYLALGIYGWFVEGLLLGTRFAIPLRPADNVFHLLLSLPALIILAWHGRVSRGVAERRNAPGRVGVGTCE